MARKVEAVTTSYPQRYYDTTLDTGLHSRGRALVYSKSYDSNEYPPVSHGSCSQQERSRMNKHASMDDPSMSPHTGTRSHSRPVGTTSSTSHHFASNVTPHKHDHLWSPDKRCISVGSIPNERYALDAKSSSEHGNEDDFLVHVNGHSVCMCVFDGHDGMNAVKFVVRYMKANVFDTKSWITLSEINRREEIESALCEFIRVTDKDFFKWIGPSVEEKRYLQSQIPKEMKSYQAQQCYPRQVARLQQLESLISGGCTAVIAVLTSSRLYVANVGDSRAILAYQESDGSLQLKQLSEDHGVENEQEMQRLTAIGLDREQLKKSGRLGTQENTRSIGDYSIKGGYKDVDVLSHATDEPGTAIPHVVSVNIDPYSFKYLILMSDGVYKTLEAVTDAGKPGNDTLVGIIEQQVNKNGWNNISMNVLKRIRIVQHDLYQRSAREDIRSPAATANRKRDDMTLLVYKFDVEP